MSVKTFTTGEVLTASDTNTYLANSGLVYVTQADLTSALQITNCFSTTYDAYRIVVNTATVSASADITVQLVSGSTPYTTANYNDIGTLTGFASGPSREAAQNVYGYWVMGRVDSSLNFGMLTFDIAGLASGQRPRYIASCIDASYSRIKSGYLNVTTGFDGIKIMGPATWTGKCRIYGYRQS
jgi:hypothetical protein